MGTGVAFVAGGPPLPPVTASASSSHPPQLPSASLVPRARRRHRRPSAAAIRVPPLLRFPLPLIVRSVRLVGAVHLPDSVLHDALDPLVGTRATRKQILEALRPADEWFAVNGFVASRVAVAGFPSRANGHVLTIASVEAVLISVRMDALDKDGNVDRNAVLRTRESVVCRALGVKIGSIFRWHPNAFQRLLALGVFEYARAELEVFGPNEVGVLVSVQERKTGRLEPGAGINSDGRVYGDVSLVDANFRGRAQYIRAEWQRRLGMARSAGSLEFVDPRVGARIPVSYRARVYRDSNSSRSLPGLGDAGHSVAGAASAAGALRNEHDRDRDGFLVEIGWRPSPLPKLHLGAGPLFERIHPLRSSSVDMDCPDHQAMMMLTASYNGAEASALPRHGGRINADYGFGAPVDFHGANEIFHRVSARLAQYFPLGATSSLAVGLSLGTGSKNLPWHEQKPLGGPATIRGYKYGELGRVPSFATGRIEIRVPLVSPTADDVQGDDATAAAASAATDAAVAASATANADAAGDITVNKRSAFIGMKAAAISLGLPKLPGIVGVVFADTASADMLGTDQIGASYGVGLRVGGVISVEYAWTRAGREPRLHFGLVDRNL
jgi:outer membrane protein assembly factor BamA